MVTPIISIVVAVSSSGIIGSQGGMPWRLPSDLKRFRRLTMGKPVIMGRKTFESIGKPLDGRDNIIVTRQEGYAPEGVHVVSGFDAAIELGTELAVKSGVDEVVIIGGGEVYAQSLAMVQRIHLTEVHGDIAGDTKFPPLRQGEWKEVSREAISRADRDSADTSYVVLEKGDER